MFKETIRHLQKKITFYEKEKEEKKPHTNRNKNCVSVDWKKVDTKCQGNINSVRHFHTLSSNMSVSKHSSLSRFKARQSFKGIELEIEH